MHQIGHVKLPLARVLAAALTSLACIACVIWAIHTAMVTRAWLQTAMHTQAVVTQIRSGWGQHAGATAYAGWTDVNGDRREVTFQAMDANNPPQGTAVDIVYDPAPGGRASRSADVWHDVIAEIVFAVIFAVFSAMIVYKSDPRRV